LDVEKIEFIPQNQNFDLGKTDPKKYHKNLLPNINKNIRNNKYCDPNFQNISSSYGKYTKNENLEFDLDLMDDEEEINEIKLEIEERKENIEKGLNDFFNTFKSQKFQWIRFSDLINLKKGENISLNEVFIEDTYLICVIKGFQKYSISKLFKLIGPSYPEIGYYEINLIEDKTIFIDDYLPLSYNFILYFTNLPIKDKFYIGIILLIQKALAKFCECYYNLYIDGSEKNYYPYSSLFGYSNYDLEDLDEYSNDELYSLIQDNLNHENLLTLRTNEKSPKDLIFESYIITGTGKDNGLDVIKLRPPLKNNDNSEIEEIKIDFNSAKTKCEINIVNFVEESSKKIKNKKKRKKLLNDERQYELMNASETNNYDKFYEEKIGILDSLGIDKNIQEQFFEKYKNDMEEGFYILFKTFMENGTSKKSFLKIMNN
jgi:hypothetical protein